MLFRVGYHSCQLAILALLATAVGTLIKLPVLVASAGWIICSVSVVGLLLGLIGITTGIRTACPNCGNKDTWLYAHKFLGIHCDRCGVYGGYPMMHIVPLKVEDVVNTGAVGPESDRAADAYDEWKK